MREEICIFWIILLSIANKSWSSQSAEEIKPITVICPLEDENLKKFEFSSSRGQIIVIGFITCPLEDENFKKF